MNILVTGGCGFIGSHIVDTLVDQNHDVVVIDNQSANNDVFHFNNKVKQYHKVDICDYESVVKIMKGIDCVFHLAAESRIGPCIENPLLATKTNVDGTCVLLQSARVNNVKRFIYSSTSSAYGMNSMPQVETMHRDCLNPYSVTKVAAEDLCVMYYKLYGLPTITFRYFNVYGERQPNKGQYAPVIAIFMRQKHNKESLTIVGDGSQRRDFVHVNDIVQANMLAMNVDNSECFGKVFNIGSGKNISVKEIANIIDDNQVHLPPRIGEATDTLADISLAKNLLKFEPKHDVVKWISSQLRWPTLEGRLKHPLTSEKQALEQLKQSGTQLSEYGEKLLKKLKKDVDETK